MLLAPSLPMQLLSWGRRRVAGAVLGGVTAGRWTSSRVAAAQVLRCFGGGVLMAWGSLLTPGSNDGLLLIGIPLLQPHAWLALASMVLAIASSMLLANGVRNALR